MLAEQLFEAGWQRSENSKDRSFKNERGISNSKVSQFIFISSFGARLPGYN